MKKLIFRILLLVIFLFSSNNVNADAYLDIKNNQRLAGGNLLAYPLSYTDSVILSDAPIGYTPFHIEHYGRHGSRWLLRERDYMRPVSALAEAKKAGKLTALGDEILQQLMKEEEGARQHYGDLTELGAMQHRGIARRMYHNFPEVFKDSAHIDARSTVVIRCILSMANEMMELAGLNPGLRIKQESSRINQWYLNNTDLDTVAQAVRRSADPVFKEFARKQCDPQPLMNRLFNDSEYVSKNVDSYDLFSKLFELASNQQSHGNDTSLYKMFTNDELYHQWVCNNANWYLTAGNAPATMGRMPYTQRYLLADFIESADRAISDGGNSATMRFGHESVVLPLVCFMELDDYGQAIESLDKVADVWHNYDIFPMASNVQLIFYKGKNSSDDILVRALLNEREVRLPVMPYDGNFYRWNDVRDYYKDKLNQFDARFKE